MQFHWIRQIVGREDYPFCFRLRARNESLEYYQSRFWRIIGEPWDEKGHSEITEIYISHGDDTINSIQFQYVEKRTLKLSELYGESESVDRNFHAVSLFNLSFLQKRLTLPTFFSLKSFMNLLLICSIKF